MKKFIAVFVLTSFLLVGKVFAVNNIEVVDRGWNKINLGVLFPDWAKPFCEIFSERNAGRWISNKLLNTSQNPLYSRCRERRTGTPAGNEVYNIPVLSLKYFPLDPSDPTKLNRTVVGTDLSDLSLSYVRNRITSVQNATIDTLERGSAFHGYKDNSARPVFDYHIYEEKEFLKPVPVKVSGTDRNADHVKILTEDVNICDLVNNRGVKEVWLWMYHSDVASPIESYQRGPYGGLGNGYMDLPLCNKTYTVYDYNYGRGVGEAVEDHGHHIETLLRSVNYDIWQNKFVGQCGAGKEFYRCGWTHYPPNVMQYCSNHDYDWANETTVLSDCEDWKPDGSGVKKQVSCHNWAGETCGNDSGDKFKVWWMQNIPSAWWVWIGDYDGAKQRGKGLD